MLNLDSEFRYSIYEKCWNLGTKRISVITFWIYKSLLCSPTFSKAAVVAFFTNVGDVGLYASLMVCCFLNCSIVCICVCEMNTGDSNHNLSSFCLTTMQYYLKAQFHFNKNQFADLMIINGIAGSVSQVNFTMHFHYMQFVILCMFLCFFITYKLLMDFGCAILHQLIIMPVLTPLLGEEKMLSLGLFFSFAHVRTLHNYHFCKSFLSNEIV